MRQWCSEEIDHDPGNDLLSLAPHGGNIEPYTDDQAQRFAEKVGRASLWVFEGYKDGGGAFQEWHEPSTEIRPANYQLLADITETPFEFAVAFHGYTRDGITVGGGVDSGLQALLAQRLNNRLPDYPVRIGFPGSGHAGFMPTNIVNRYCRAGGIQLEQSRAVRKNEADTVVDTIADVLRKT